MAKVPEVLRLARQFRAELVKGENQVTGEMIAAYRGIVERLRPELKATLVKLEAERAAGKLPSPLLVARRDDVRRFLADAERELQRYSRASAGVIATRQSTLVTVAGTRARELARAAAANPTLHWAQLNPTHVENFVGLLRPGTPAHDLLDELVPTGVGRVRQAMISGLSVGRTPEKIARDVEGVLGGNMGRFLTVARTEDMRAYRMATQENFRANADVVSGWRWHASLSYSTCAACLSMHGKVFPLDREMDSHWNCRCVQIPVVQDAPVEEWESGEEWLQSQPGEIQRRALGDAKFEAWKAGEITLDDLRGHSHSDVWGGSYHEVGLEKAKEKAERASNVSVLLVQPARYQPAKHFSGDNAAQLADSPVLEVAGRLSTPMPNADEIGLPNLYRLAEAQGFTGLPTVVSPEEFDRLVEAAAKQGELPQKLFFRGLHRDKLGGVKAQVVGTTDAEKAGENFLSGVYYTGTYKLPGQPSGIYFTNDVVKASGFSGSNPSEGRLIKALLNTQARTAELNFLRNKREDVQDALELRIQRELLSRKSDTDRIVADLRALQRLSGNDEGYIAVLLGYDGIVWDDFKYGKMLVLLNRRAIIVSKDISIPG